MNNLGVFDLNSVVETFQEVANSRKSGHKLYIVLKEGKATVSAFRHRGQSLDEILRNALLSFHQAYRSALALEKGRVIAKGHALLEAAATLADARPLPTTLFSLAHHLGVDRVALQVECLKQEVRLAKALSEVLEALRSAHQAYGCAASAVDRKEAEEQWQRAIKLFAKSDFSSLVAAYSNPKMMIGAAYALVSSGVNKIENLPPWQTQAEDFCTVLASQRFVLSQGVFGLESKSLSAPTEMWQSVEFCALLVGFADRVFEEEEPSQVASSLSQLHGLMYGFMLSVANDLKSDEGRAFKQTCLPLLSRIGALIARSETVRHLIYHLQKREKVREAQVTAAKVLQRAFRRTKYSEEGAKLLGIKNASPEALQQRVASHHYSYPIRLNPPRPPLENTLCINQKKAKEWIALQATDELKRLAEKIVQEMRYIPFREFMEQLKKATHSFNAQLMSYPEDQRNYIIAIPGHDLKSNRWVAELALPYHITLPEAILKIDPNTPELAQKYFESHSEVNIAMYDDGVFSGEQLWRFALQVYNVSGGKARIHLIVPFQSPQAVVRKGWDHISWISDHSLLMPLGLSPRFTIADREMLAGLSSDQRMSRRVLAYGDWKKFDDHSTITAVYEGEEMSDMINRIKDSHDNGAWMRNLGKKGYNFPTPPEPKRSRFIPPIQPPYKFRNAQDVTLAEDALTEWQTDSQ